MERNFPNRISPVLPEVAERARHESPLLLPVLQRQELD